MSNTKKIRYIVLATTAAFNKYLATTAKNAESLRSRVQILAFAAAEHYLASVEANDGKASGDYTRCNQVVALAVNTGYINAKQLVKYFQLTCGLQCIPAWDEAKKKDVTPEEFNGHSGFHNLAHLAREELIETARETMWWTTIKIDSPFKDASLDTILNKAMDDFGKRQASAVKAADEAGIPVDEFVSEHIDSVVTGGTSARILTMLGIDRVVEQAQNLMANAAK